MRIRKPNYIDQAVAAVEWVDPASEGGFWEMKAAKDAVDAAFSRDLDTGGKEYRKLPANKCIVLHCDGIAVTARWEDLP